MARTTIAEEILKLLPEPEQAAYGADAFYEWRIKVDKETNIVTFGIDFHHPRLYEKIGTISQLYAVTYATDDMGIKHIAKAYASIEIDLSKSVDQLISQIKKIDWLHKGSDYYKIWHDKVKGHIHHPMGR